ncbi:MAG TPA: recombination regulator RecX [Ramlibacter sp.]|uniref:recombination regulator RecX n=1 Tax=Ramlibacter sp. TaxID=1917967 RepID=UPI002D1C2CB1|nr:recombination regulator RecX [Ramlibacter sp.]HVZ47036.1 recombination regulator RecX [Ramlibacter sp.]
MPLAKKPSLKGRALALLSRREHSRAELERKLAGHEEEPGQLARALDELQARGFLDEQRVVDSIVHRKAARFGAARVKEELLAKRVDPARAAQALALLRTSEVERAREVWRRKFGEPPRDAVERGRQARFLAARGFSGETIARVLRASED